MNKPLTALNVAVRALQYKVDLAKAAREKMAAEILKSDYSATYEVRWLSGKVQGLYEGHYAGLLLHNLDTDNHTQALAATASFISFAEGHLKTWSPMNSTSAYANAAAGEEFLALRELLKMAQDLHAAMLKA
jgi:hypothetical protein